MAVLEKGGGGGRGGSGGGVKGGGDIKFSSSDTDIFYLQKKKKWHTCRSRETIDRNGVLLVFSFGNDTCFVICVLRHYFILQGK